MKILVTGGAGYIGSHTAQKLRDVGHEVIIYDNLSNGFRQAVLDSELIVADLVDEITLARAFDSHGFDAVMHFAASIYSDESVAQPLTYYTNNLNGLLCLLRQCRRCAVPYFVFSSSAAVYAPSATKIVEDTPLEPSSPYGWSKAMGERILCDEQRTREMGCAILRYYNVAGADPNGRLGASGPARHLIRVALQAAVGAANGVTIYGTDYDTPDGTCVRDYIHVDDLARIHADALAHISERGGLLLINCGYGRGYSVREIVSTVQRLTGVDFPVREGRRRPGDPPMLVADNRRLRSVLKWAPDYDDIEAIVYGAWEWEKKLRAGIWDG